MQCMMYPPRRVARIFIREGGHENGGIEGPERGAEARSAEGIGMVPSQGVGSLVPQKIFEK